MPDTISVCYPSDSLDQIHITYSIELAEQVQTISCKIEDKTVPLWLQLRKFNITSLKKQGLYVPLYNEANGNTNVDTSLFIDLVYDLIMDKERQKVNAPQKK